MAYTVSITPKAIKELAKIPEPYQSKIKTVIANLADNPRPPGCTKLEDWPAYRIRVGAYRLIYEVADKVLQVLVVKVGDRKDVYRK